MEKVNNFFKKVGLEIKETITSKWLDSFVGAGAALLSFISFIAYFFMPNDLQNATVIAFCFVGFLLFLILSLFRQTSVLAPVSVMVFDLLAIVAIVNTDGMIDYITTQMFDGLDLSALAPALVASIICLILSFILSSVAMYLPKKRKTKEEKEEVLTEGEAK